MFEFGHGRLRVWAERHDGSSGRFRCRPVGMG
jgi:hypothetical protein